MIVYVLVLKTSKCWFDCVFCYTDYLGHLDPYLTLLAVWLCPRIFFLFDFSSIFDKK